MGIVDILIIIFIVVMALAGWRSGFVRSFGSLLALIASVVVAFWGMGWLHDSFGLTFAEHPWITIGAFLVLSLIASRLAQYIVDALDLVRKIIAIIPFVNFINNLLGAAFGVLQSAVAILVLAYVAVTLVPVGDIRTSLLSSTVVERAVDIESNAGLL